MMNRTPGPNEIYRHFKGNLYKVITLAQHTETGETLVVYQALYGEFQVFARPLSMFVSEVDHEKYPEVQEKYRFTLVQEILGQGGAVVGAENADRTERAASVPASPSGTPETASEASAAPDPEEEEFVLDPVLLRFLDADTYEEKLEIFVSMRDGITDDMLLTMAASLDLELEEGEWEERYQALKNCLMTLEKYECNRLR